MKVGHGLYLIADQPYLSGPIRKDLLY